jgi:hypothetical protein
LKHEEVLKNNPALGKYTCITCDFNDVKNPAYSRLDSNGIYLIYDKEDLIYVGSSYVQSLKDRLNQYTGTSKTGNTLARALERTRGIDRTEALKVIFTLTIKAFDYPDDLEYNIIRNSKGLINKSGVQTDPNE